MSCNECLQCLLVFDMSQSALKNLESPMSPFYDLHSFVWSCKETEKEHWLISSVHTWALVLHGSKGFCQTTKLGLNRRESAFAIPTLQLHRSDRGSRLTCFKIPFILMFTMHRQLLQVETGIMPAHLHGLIRKHFHWLSNLWLWGLLLVNKIYYYNTFKCVCMYI